MLPFSSAAPDPSRVGFGLRRTGRVAADFAAAFFAMYLAAAERRVLILILILARSWSRIRDFTLGLSLTVEHELQEGLGDLVFKAFLARRVLGENGSGVVTFTSKVAVWVLGLGVAKFVGRAGFGICAGLATGLRVFRGVSGEETPESESNHPSNRPSSTSNSAMAFEIFDEIHFRVKKMLGFQPNRLKHKQENGSMAEL